MPPLTHWIFRLALRSRIHRSESMKIRRLYKLYLPSRTRRIHVRARLQATSRLVQLLPPPPAPLVFPVRPRCRRLQLGSAQVSALFALARQSENKRVDLFLQANTFPLATRFSTTRPWLPLFLRCW